MKIALFGAGGVGGYFGACLSRAGEDVHFIARGRHLEAIRRDGLRVDSAGRDFTINPVNATDNPRDVGIVDAVLVAVKAWQVPDAAQAMQPVVGPKTIAVPMGNGVEAPDQLAEILGKEHVLGGYCKISAFIAEPGHIVHAGVEPFVAFGRMDGLPSQQAVRLRDAFRRAGVNVEIPNDIQAGMWQKFIFIAAVSGLGAVARVPVGRLRKSPGTRRLLEGSLEEILEVSRAKGIQLPDDIINSTMKFVDSLDPEVIPSMQRDIMAGDPSELESQTGAVVRMGSETGISTPLNEFIYNCLLPQEKLAREDRNR